MMLFAMVYTLITTAGASQLHDEARMTRKSEINQDLKLQQSMPRVGQEEEEELTIEEQYRNKLNNFRAFEYGLEGDKFAANFSTCAIHGLTWYFYELNTFKVKLRYASYDDTVTNTTLFIQNFTNLLTTCTDVVENIYYYGKNEATRFASGTDWALGLL